MKKALIASLVLLIFLSGALFLSSQIKQKIFRDFSADVISNQLSSPTPYEKIVPSGKEKTSEFVPYWTMSSGIDSEADSLIYFGVSPNIDGINIEDEGYRLLPRFLDLTEEREKHLAIRMLDQDTSTQILESSQIQDRVIAGSIDLAKEKNFDGIVIDLEYKALPFDSVIKGINSFFTKFSREAKKNNLKFSVLIYGDSFFRVRPYDVKHIGEESDEVMIMAYDFHKAGGNPGPNFPLDGQDEYGYSFKEMVSDFLSVIPPEKITVVFGMFGYDWRVDEKNVSLGSATALSLAQMQQRFVNGCKFSNCALTRDEDSKELVATYTDGEEKHTVWFEDIESSDAKKTFLRERGINSFSYWAHSYFQQPIR